MNHRRGIRSRSSTSARRLGLVVAALALVLGGSGCVKKPTMTVHHVELSGVRIGLPPTLAVVVTVVVAIHNPNSYDVAVRGVRGRMLLAGRYALPVDFRAGGDGVWLPSDLTTPVRVPVVMPVGLAAQLARDALQAPAIPYLFQGAADVTATRTFKLERDNYAVSEGGVLSRAELQAVLARSL